MKLDLVLCDARRIQPFVAKRSVILHSEYVSLSLDSGIAMGWDLNLPKLPLILTFCAESDHSFIKMCVLVP